MKLQVKKFLALLLCLSLSVTFVLSLSGCASKGESSQVPADSQTTVPETPAAETSNCNPLTGEAFTQQNTEVQRPVAVMVDNAYAALPQSGVAAASVVYEMVTEGGITRLMAVYNSTAELSKVGPVRSTRDQFLQLAIPQNFVLLHIGTSIYASDLLRACEYSTVDGIYLGVISYEFDAVRAQGRYNEHCFYTTTALADAGIAHEEIAATGSVPQVFQFMQAGKPARLPKDGTAADISFSFSQTTPTAFHYDAQSKLYAKSVYGDPQLDETTGTQLSFTNLFILGCDVGLKGDGLCTDFDFSSGEGFYFSQGGYQPVRWKKGSVDEALKLYAEDGSTLTVNVGKSYVAFADNRALQKTLLTDTVSPYSDAGDKAVSNAG